MVVWVLRLYMDVAQRNRDGWREEGKQPSDGVRDSNCRQVDNTDNTDENTHTLQSGGSTHIRYVTTLFYIPISITPNTEGRRGRKGEESEGMVCISQ